MAREESGQVFTCNTHDDGYAETLEHPKLGNSQGELGRSGYPYLPEEAS